jgi:hypothetical protein
MDHLHVVMLIAIFQLHQLRGVLGKEMKLGDDDLELLELLGCCKGDGGIFSLWSKGSLLLSITSFTCMLRDLLLSSTFSSSSAHTLPISSQNGAILLSHKHISLARSDRAAVLVRSDGIL